MAKRYRGKARLAQTYAAKGALVGEQVEIMAQAGDDGQPTGPKRFAGVAYTGGMIPGYTATPKLPYPYVIDLAGTTKSRTNHANLDHKSTQRVGHLTNVEIGAKEIRVEGLLSAATKFRDEVADGAASGQPWEVSIECALGGGKLVREGESAIVNGQKFEGPFIRMTKNKFTDIAFVTHGADGGNDVKIAASTAKEVEMNEFEQFMAACGVDPETATDVQRARLQKAFDAECKAAEQKDEKKFKSFAEIAAEQRATRDRHAAIGKLAERAMQEHPLYIEQIEGMATLAMERNTSERDFELELLRELRTVAGKFRSGQANPGDPKMLEAALCMASGLPNIEKHYNEDTLDQVSRAGMRDFGLQQLLVQTAAANGRVCRAGERIHNGNIREILEYCFPPAHARLSGFSAVDMSGILGNVANKEILAGYMEEDDTWREIAEIKSVSNFQQYTSYRMLDSLEYEQIGPTGRITHGKLGQESYTRQAKTYARMLGLTREQIINDDLSAFDDIRTVLGRGGAKKFLNIFWAAFIDNSTFFTAGLTNYTSGSTTNLGTDGVGIGLTLLAYRKMTSPSADGTKRVGASMSRPEILLVPPELEANARLLYTSRNLITGANTTSGDANIYAGLFRPVVQNRLSDSSFTGYSTTAYYVFGKDLKPMVVSFLNGQQTPTVESADADFNQLGIQFRGYHDFGCDKSEYLSGVKSKGAA